MKTETRSHLTEEEDDKEEEDSSPSATLNCGEVTIFFPIQKQPEDYYYDSEGGYTQPSWKPPIPIEDGIWKPIHVKTNGEGRKRLVFPDPLVEIYDVKVDLCGKTYGKIHGKILFDCTTYNTYLFDHDKESALVIHKKGSLPFNGPDVAPLGYDPIAFLVDLNIDDDKLCEGLVTWDFGFRPVNEWLCGEVKGKNGSVQVIFAVMEGAWLGELDVKLIKSLTEQTIGFKIHGDIIVYINDMPYLRSFIFSKKSSDSFTIKSMESIPLSKSLFCCRYGSSLVVKIDLWNSDTNEPLVRGALFFPPEYYGDSVGKLNSPYGEIQVKVNWVDYHNHSKTCEALRLFLGDIY
ncbi:jasmonate-induced protein-like protein [Carex littledalei]|uniref:Jasmonate-induced protein-like protein n=1 Tax=Carex littledalei TaxID=544730 RepID=A0A833QJH7_9POAL|nr:jasmonate-induced protein-like protein [Carex littledalei]